MRVENGCPNSSTWPSSHIAQTWFTSATCPTGWAPVPSAEGRVIVSVSNPSVSGLTLHEALSDRQDVSHFHNYSATISIPSLNLAADSCCNTDGAQNGEYSTDGVTYGAASGLPFTQLLLCTVVGTVNGSIPFGSVGYFEQTVPACPANWITFDEADGRALVPGYDGTEVVPSANDPLGNLEDRTHAHTFTASVSTDSISYVGIDGCCNDSPSQNGEYTVYGNVNNASSSVPYIQMLTCLSEVQTFTAELPGEALLFRPTVGCPTGWELVNTVAGRFLVVLPYQGEAGASFGGNSILASM